MDTPDDILRCLAHLPATGEETIPARAALDAYVRVVRELRAIAMEARARVERSAVAVREAREFVHRSQRRAQKNIDRRRSDRIEGVR